MDNLTNILIIGFKLVLLMIISVAFTIALFDMSHNIFPFLVSIFDYENYKMVFIDELCSGIDTDVPPYMGSVLLSTLGNLIIPSICSIMIITTDVSVNKKIILTCFTVVFVLLLNINFLYDNFYFIVDVCSSPKEMYQDRWMN